MSSAFQLYRFAWIEAKNITTARLEAEFRDGVPSAHALESAIGHLLTTERTCTPWRVTEAEQRGSLEGMRMAALEFYWEHRPHLQLAIHSALECEEAPSEPQATAKSLSRWFV